MTKVKALLLSIVCSATAIVSFANQQTIPLLAFGVGAVLFFSIWFYKYQRDYRIQARARLERQSAAQTSLRTSSMHSLPYMSQAYVASLSREQYGQLLANYRQLGLHPTTRDPFLVSQLDRYSGTSILGIQGSGKSRLMQSLIMQDILSGNSVIVLDPHLDLTDNCIASLPDELPREWLNKIYILDMLDEEYPFGLNLLDGVDRSSSIALAQSIEGIIHVFQVLWPEVMSQQYLLRYLRASVLSMMK